ncbi:hypothetical protein TNCV_46511 [Trichonephila clavipes]|nr:hypothetical protein TNCV_46511 [Trichonephila clavipes]
MHYIYGRANNNGRAALRTYDVQFLDQRMSNHRIFQLLHRQLRETRSFHVTKYDAGRRRAVRSPRLEESTLNVVAAGPESSTRDLAHHKKDKRLGPLVVSHKLWGLGRDRKNFDFEPKSGQ